MSEDSAECAHNNFCYWVQEYDEQGRIETEKALNELRLFVRKNSSDVWEIIGKLNNANRLETNFVTTHAHYQHFSLVRDGDMASGRGLGGVCVPMTTMFPHHWKV